MPEIATELLPGQSRTRKVGSHAVVVGSSLGGLLAARALTDHFERVTIVERDRLPDGPEVRKGVPQARHVHALLTRGYELLTQYFPGLEEELIAAGAPRVDWAADVLTMFLGGWSPRYRSGIATRTCSRALLEYLVRRRVAGLPGVTIREGWEAVGLSHDGRTNSVTGLRLRPRAGASEVEELAADLVVDAAGRTSRTPDWLASLGYPRPRETVINAFLGYTTRWYQRPPDFEADWRALLISSKAPDARRGGVIYPVEGGRWIVTLGGVGRDYPPTDEAGFLDFARSLRSPLLYEAIKDAEPLSPIQGYQRTDNCLRHYEELERRPERLIVMGDAACAFNPVYGQGMAVASMEAQALGEMLRGYGLEAGFAARFQQRLAAIIETPWLMATGEDLRWPTTVGDRPSIGPMGRLIQRYLDQVMAVMPDSPAVHLGFTEVAHLLRPPIRLFQPALVARVAGHTLALRRRPRPTLSQIALPRHPDGPAVAGELTTRIGAPGSGR